MWQIVSRRTESPKIFGKINSRANINKPNLQRALAEPAHKLVMARSKTSARKARPNPLPPRRGPTPRKMTARGFPPHFFKSQSPSQSLSQSQSPSSSQSRSRSPSQSQSQSSSQSQSRSPSPSSLTSGSVPLPPRKLSKPLVPPQVHPSPQPLAE